MNSSFSSPYKNTSFNSSATGTSMTSSYSRRRYTTSEMLIMSEGSNHLLEHYGAQLPSMVKVVLNKVDDTQAVSLRLDPNGWAWLVWKRQLYIWRHVSDGKKNTIPCRELALPVSDLVHHARLVCVVGNGVVPSCIAVSPEGHISYWPNISNESSMVSVSADVTGQECDSLSSIWPTGCILATTSATVLLIKPIPGSKPSLACSSLSHAASGWLGGLTKKMSFLMPMGGGSALETKRAKVAIPLSKENPAQPGLKNTTVYVLAGSLFQTWNVTSHQQNCLYDINVDDIVRKKFHAAVWDGRVDLRGIQIWLLDIVSHSNTSKISLLAAALDQSEANAVVNYGILTFDPKTGNARDKVELTMVDFTTPKSVTDEETLYSWKLLVCQGFYYMMSSDRILIVSGSDECPLDGFSSEAVGAPFLGNGLVSEGVVVVFTPRFGLLSIRYNKNLDGTMGLNDSFAEVRVPDHLALSMTQHNILDLSMSEDNVNRYKSAFLNFCGKRMEECQEILLSLFPSHVPSMTPNDPIDIWTVALCEKLIDDAPVSDPRWGSSIGREDGNDPMGLKSKMLIKNFLADKKKGLEIFFGFLKATGIWSRLTGVVLRNELEATASVLYNFYEKIGFAMALHFLQTEPRYRKYIDPAIKSIVAIRKENRAPPSHLSFNDFFYKDVSRVHQFLTALVTVEEELINDSEPSLVLETVSENTEVLIVVFSELNQLLVTEKFGLIKNTFLQPLMEPPNQYDVIPWYIQSHALEALTKQAGIILTASQLTEDDSVKIDFFKQLEQLTDLILDGLKVNVESIKSTSRYAEKFGEFETIRAKLIGNLVDLEPVGALSLAEKYLDFNILVSVCYAQKDFGRLELFFEKYYELEFPRYTFEWFLKQKKDAEIIEYFSRSKYQALVGDFLKEYPHVAWHHSTVIEDYKGASKTLANLAKAEEVSLDDKKFMLCMAKLGILASGTTENEEGSRVFENINKELAVVRYQNELSDAALEQYGLDRESMRVLTPIQLIDVYTSDLLDPDVVNYWKAICLCDHVGGYRDEKRLLVVARCILRDPWDEWSIEHPVDVIEPSYLFKLISLGVSNGEDVENLYRINELANLDILQRLFEQPNAKYLLSAAYEHLCFQTRGNMSS